MGLGTGLAHADNVGVCVTVPNRSTSHSSGVGRASGPSAAQITPQRPGGQGTERRNRPPGLHMHTGHPTTAKLSRHEAHSQTQGDCRKKLAISPQSTPKSCYEALHTSG